MTRHLIDIEDVEALAYKIKEIQSSVENLKKVDPDKIERFIPDVIKLIVELNNMFSSSMLIKRK